jgi:hypothetical protein
MFHTSLHAETRRQKQNKMQMTILSPPPRGAMQVMKYLFSTAPFLVNLQNAPSRNQP